MLRLVKLGIYALVGYMLYEFACGLTGDVKEIAAPAAPAASPSTPRGGSRAGSTAKRRAKRVPTHDPDGHSESHFVGRGVVRR